MTIGVSVEHLNPSNQFDLHEFQNDFVKLSKSSCENREVKRSLRILH